MVNDLKRLLQDNVENRARRATSTSPRWCAWSPAAYAATPQHGRRRCFVAAVGAVVGGAALATLDLGLRNRCDRQPPSDPSGRCVSLEDARPAAEGTDYRGWPRTARDREPGATATDQYSGVTEDGARARDRRAREIPTTSTRGDAGRPRDRRPATGCRAAPEQIEHPVALGTDAARCFRTGPEPGQTANSLANGLLGARSSTHRGHLDDAALARAAGLLGVRRRRSSTTDGCYLGVEDADLGTPSATCGRSRRRPGRRPRRAAKVGDIDITGSELTWTANTDNDPTTLIHVRDLTTGEERDVRPPDGDRVQPARLGPRRGPHACCSSTAGQAKASATTGRRSSPWTATRW